MQLTTIPIWFTQTAAPAVTGKKSTSNGAAGAAVAKPPTKTAAQKEAAKVAAQLLRESWTAPAGKVDRPLYTDGGFKFNKIPDDPDEPLQWFMMLFDEDTIAQICEDTNKYKEFKEAPLTPKEFKAFVGCMARLGLTSPPNLHDVWSPGPMGYNIPFITDCFPRDRFFLILAHFHLHGPMTEEERNKARTADKLYTMRTFIDSFNRNLAEMIQPGEWLVVDECLFPSKAHSGIRQYNASKPNKFGVKIYCLVDVQTGLLIGSEIYQGKHSFEDKGGYEAEEPDTSDSEPDFDSDSDVDSDVGDYSKFAESTRCVLQLVHPWRDSWRGVCTDNWFTSYDLLQQLWTLKFRFVGTWRKSRTAFPSLLQSWMKKQSRPRGEHSVLLNADGIGIATAVHDTKNLAILDSASDGVSLATMLRSTVSKSKVDKKKHYSRDKVTVEIPQSMKLYQQTMRGVDTWDQMIHSFNLARITRTSWWRKIFWGFFVTSMIVASHKYFNLYRSINSGTPLSLKEFQEAIATDLVDGQSFKKHSHFPYSAQLQQQQVGEKRKSVGPLRHQFKFVKARGVCVFCNGRTRQKCIFCNYFVCQKDCVKKHIKL